MPLSNGDKCRIIADRIDCIDRQLYINALAIIEAGSASPEDLDTFHDRKRELEAARANLEAELERLHNERDQPGPRYRISGHEPLQRLQERAD